MFLCAILFVAPGDIYTDLKHGIDKIQDANFHLNMQTLTNAAQKTDAERSLFSELRRRNEDLKDTREDLKVDRLKLAKENAEQKQLIDQLQCDLKIANEVADQQSKRSRETEEATKRELESLDAGIKELEVKLCETSKRNAVLSEEKESYKAHNDALLKEVERQDKVIRKMGRQIDSYTTINSDFTHMVEPMFKLVRALKVRLVFLFNEIVSRNTKRSQHIVFSVNFIARSLKKCNFLSKFRGIFPEAKNSKSYSPRDEFKQKLKVNTFCFLSRPN